MSEKKIVVPLMMEAAGYVASVENRGERFIEPYVLKNLNDKILKAALRWMIDEFLHEKNVDFHKAIQAREHERYPCEGGADSYARVAFEFGASFARNYIRNHFLAPESEIPLELKNFIWGDWQAEKITRHLGGWDPIGSHNNQLLEAYRLGRKSGESK